MPFFKHITLPNESQIGIWEITETLQSLIVQLGNSVEEPSKNNLKKEVHQLQWYASRLLLKYLFNEAKIILNKDEHNKPSLLIDGQPYAISITHAGKYAAVSVARNRKLGIDLEKVDERILTVSHKFLNAQEIDLLNKNGIDQAIEITKIWSAKESMYKLYGKKSLDFKENLLIQSIDKPLKGTIFTNNLQIELDIDFIFIDDFILTYASRQSLF
jgi:phosphopantetheinyl transferase